MPSLDPLVIPAAVGLVAAAILALRAGRVRSRRTPAWCFPAITLAIGVETAVLTVVAATNADVAMAPALFPTAVLLTYAAHRRLNALARPPRSPDT